MPRTCLKCQEEFSDYAQLNYTCRCYENHALCFPCSEDLRYSEARELFGIDHYLDVKKYHADDVQKWVEQGRHQKRLQQEFEEYFIKPNLVQHNGWTYLEIGKILEEYRGVKSAEVEQRWEEGIMIQGKQGRINRRRDIIYQIRTPIDTTFTLCAIENPIFNKELKKHQPFTLKLPICCCAYSEIRFIFEPETTFEYTHIDMFTDPALCKYRHNQNILVLENNLAVTNSMLHDATSLNKRLL